MNKGLIAAILERAVKTFVQALLALWATNDMFDITNVNLEHSLALALSAAVISVLTSVASIPVGTAGPSLTTETVAPEAPPRPVA